jgi:hypothetical protein
VCPGPDDRRFFRLLEKMVAQHGRYEDAGAQKVHDRYEHGLIVQVVFEMVVVKGAVATAVAAPVETQIEAHRVQIVEHNRFVGIRERHAHYVAAFRMQVQVDAPQVLETIVEILEASIFDFHRRSLALMKRHRKGRVVLARKLSNIQLEVREIVDTQEAELTGRQILENDVQVNVICFVFDDGEIFDQTGEEIGWIHGYDTAVHAQAQVHNCTKRYQCENEHGRPAFINLEDVFESGGKLVRARFSR